MSAKTLSVRGNLIFVRVVLPLCLTITRLFIHLILLNKSVSRKNLSRLSQSSESRRNQPVFMGQGVWDRVRQTCPKGDPVPNGIIVRIIVILLRIRAILCRVWTLGESGMGFAPGLSATPGRPGRGEVP